MDRCVALSSHLPTLSYLKHSLDVLDSIDYDDDIEWQNNPFDYHDDQNTETLQDIRFEGSVGFQRSSVRNK